ncbi:hypothetical protein WDZ92_20305 [Nostoc sp. NIES-2111]
MAFRGLERLRPELVPLAEDVFFPWQHLGWATPTKREGYQAGTRAVLMRWRQSQMAFFFEDILPLADASFALQQYAGEAFLFVEVP